MEMGLTQTGSGRATDDWDSLVLKSRRKRAKDVDPRTAEQVYEGYSREAVALRRERNRQGWAEFWHSAADRHYAWAREAREKARMYEAAVVPNLPREPAPSRNGHGP